VFLLFGKGKKQQCIISHYGRNKNINQRE